MVFLQVFVHGVYFKDFVFDIEFCVLNVHDLAGDKIAGDESVFRRRIALLWVNLFDWGRYLRFYGSIADDKDGEAEESESEFFHGCAPDGWKALYVRKAKHDLLLSGTQLLPGQKIGCGRSRMHACVIN